MKTTRFAMARRAVFLLSVGALVIPHEASAHYDSLDGPVIQAAKLALEKWGCDARPQMGPERS